MDAIARVRLTNISGASVHSIAARITDLLPGTAFDDSGAGTFTRAHYRVTFRIAADACSVEVALNHPDAFLALKRVALKTGWDVVHPDDNLPIDLDSSKQRGAVAIAVPRRDEPSVTDSETPSGWRRYGSRAALVIVTVAAIWAAWQWSRTAPTISRRDAAIPTDSTVAAPSGAGGVTTDPVTGARVSAADKAAARKAAEEYLRTSVDRMRVRMRQVKLLAPEFRGNVVVQQLLDYRQALMMFHATLAEDRVMAAERLADRSAFGMAAPDGFLPAAFASPERDGYRFESVGRDCGHDGQYDHEITDLCDAMVYVARPLDGTSGLATFAYYTEDDRIHHRVGGDVPTTDDPTVDNTTPSAASDIPGALDSSSAHAQPATKAEATLLARLQGALKSALAAAGFRTLQEASVAYRDADVMKDLRTLFSAEMVFAQMTGGLYATPEKLANGGGYAATRMQPLLPGYFVQPVRQGYEFQFVGSDETAMRITTFAPFAPVYRSYVYAALPVDPGPANRRSFAIFPEGVVYATAERRVPTRTDTPLGDR